MEDGQMLLLFIRHRYGVQDISMISSVIQHHHCHHCPSSAYKLLLKLDEGALGVGGMGWGVKGLKGDSGRVDLGGVFFWRGG